MTQPDQIITTPAAAQAAVGVDSASTEQLRGRLAVAKMASLCLHCHALIRHDDEIVLPPSSLEAWHRACADELGVQYSDTTAKSDAPAF